MTAIEQINLKILTAVIEKDHGAKYAEDYARYIMDAYDYKEIKLSDIPSLIDDLEICAQCNDVTHQDYMHDGDWDDDICEWCWGNGQ